jgi:N-acetylneuraminic acid mutarotase
MKRPNLLPFLLAQLFCVTFVLGADEPQFPSMPAAVSSNATASLKGGFELFSMMGVGPKKEWDDVTNKIYVMHLTHSAKWHPGQPVPGVAGRLGASAAGAKAQVVLMGGYVVDAQGEEITVPDVNVYIEERRWYRAKDIPVPVDRAVAGVNRDRFVYLIGGRSNHGPVKNGPVNNVQVYDIEKDSWSQATPLPGTPVFGAAGGLADDTIVVVDGAKAGPEAGPLYVASDECWLGKIDKKDPNKIEWTRLPPHPGTARFGIAGGGSSKDRKIFFFGGTTTPHDYKGVSYDGQPAEVSQLTFAYDLHRGRWETISDSTSEARLDGSGIVDTPLGPVVLGGMASNRAVTSKVTLLPKK